MAVVSSITAPAITNLGEHTRRLIALRLLPFLFVLYIVNYVDRTNLAYAALGMSRDLGFSDRVFGMGAGIFFISYLALQLPGALLVERWSARRTISLTLTAWGSLTVLTSLVHTPAQLYMARFVLGAAEAGFFPGVIVYLSHWFTYEDRAKATSNFMGAIPLSAVLGSPLAGLILGVHWHGWNGWRWLFVVEGVPAILLGIVALFFLTDWPQEASWLTPEQRLWIQTTLHQQAAVPGQPIGILEALKSRTVLLLSSVLLFSYFTVYSFTFWFPTILKRQSGLTDLGVGMYGALPFIAYFLAMQINGWLSDRAQERPWHCAVPLFVAAAALGVLCTPIRSVPYLITLFTLVGIGASYISILWAMPTEVLDKRTAAAAVGLINALGSISGFLGPYVFGYLYTRTHSFVTGLLLIAITSAMGGLLTLRAPVRRSI